MKPMRTIKKYRFTNAEMQDMLNKTILLALHSITTYPSLNGFSVSRIHNITNIEKETPLAFQERFFLCMDIIAPCMEYAQLLIKRDHPNALYLFNWLCKLYTDECEINSSTVVDKNVE